MFQALNCSESDRKRQRSSWAQNHLSKTASPQSHPCQEKEEAPELPSPSLTQGNEVSCYAEEGSLCGLLVIPRVTGWPLPGTGAGRGDREAHLTAWGCPHNCGILRYILAAWSMAGPGGSPSRASNEELAGRPVGPRGTPAQGISCLYFLRKHTFPWLGGRQGWGDQKGNRFPALCQEVE